MYSKFLCKGIHLLFETKTIKLFTGMLTAVADDGDQASFLSESSLNSVGALAGSKRNSRRKGESGRLLCFVSSLVLQIHGLEFEALPC